MIGDTDGDIAPFDDIFRTSLFGVPVIQRWCDLLLIEKMFQKTPQLKAVLELGTLYGGLSQFLLMQTIARGQEFRTFDWQRYLTVGPLAQKLGLDEHFIHDDLWIGGLATVRELCSREDWHPLFLLADDGDKPKELRTFVPMLQAGDIVGVHDWGTEVNEGDIDPVRALLTPYLLETCESIDSMLRFWVRNEVTA